MPEMLPLSGRCLVRAVLLVVTASALSFASASHADAMDWSVNPQKSEIAFEAGGAKGTFKSYQTEIEFDPEMPEQTSVHVTLDMRSASTGAPETDRALQSEDFLDPARYPTAIFVARGAKPDGGGKYILEGRLTLKGMAKPLILPVSIEITGGTAAVKGETAINRLDFGIGPDSAAGLALGNDVKLTINLTAVRLDD